MTAIAERLREGRRRVAEMQAVDVKALPAGDTFSATAESDQQDERYPA